MELTREDPINGMVHTAAGNPSRLRFRMELQCKRFGVGKGPRVQTDALHHAVAVLGPVEAVRTRRASRLCLRRRLAQRRRQRVRDGRVHLRRSGGGMTLRIQGRE